MQATFLRKLRITLSVQTIVEFLLLQCFHASYIRCAFGLDPRGGPQHIDIRGSIQEFYGPPKNISSFSITPKNIKSNNVVYPKISQIAIFDEKASLIKMWKSNENHNNISVFKFDV